MLKKLKIKFSLENDTFGGKASFWEQVLNFHENIELLERNSVSNFHDKIVLSKENLCAELL